ncbi:MULTISPECIES: GNAT family N-acetyltransferase [unclassified Pseudovibrio]|uniref:GNAT family N-acetyltransferase n=1 Tax=unclassified Pseudovibrio TaxID=2627060 RepID=UPI0007B17A1B|nr:MULTISPECIES: GNAT family N-acetyltransferase [unclassified Pseudovibrio]KZK88888.1 ribosomal-protein-S5-alanine N-acetyltransferase [Pseudovibrio sp. Ad5]KZK99957.1 ribosomal-protein-S5-alanine N-acetyltransferase [Pseudovibrio sp. W74]KZL11787.1 ribosomal-protein-S5-alanine N-acetyltransferase [Pseudovibrio sp. Ad14]
MLTTTIDTQRLRLRRYKPEDLEPYWEIGHSDYEIIRWLTGASWPAQRSELNAVADFALNANPLTDTFPFAIEHNGLLIGGVDVQKPGDLNEFPELPTIGYWLSQKAQGHGLMLEACVAALHWGFARDACDTFAARVFATNYPSQKLLKKLGFEPVGVCIRYSKSLQQDVENIIMHLPRDRFEALHGDAHVMMGAAL